MIPQARFLEFLNDIEPSPTTKKNASNAHSRLRDFLKDHDDFKVHHKKTYLSGSYRRDTAIRPRVKNGNAERPDIDIVVETNHTTEDNPEDVINLLYSTLQEAYSEIRKQTRSVGIETSLADMDVVPIISPYDDDSLLYIPDRKLKDWVRTNPPGHTTWTTEVNDRAGKRFKPLVKLMKWWRRQNPTVSKKPKGFVIECITAECMDYDETNYGELFVKLLDEIVRRYQTHISLEIVPFISDPSVPGNSVTDGMTFSAFRGFYNKVKNHADIGRRALEADNEEDATKLWREIFGDRFPATKTGKAAESLMGAALTSNLSFPDRPVKPNTPGGFAS